MHLHHFLWFSVAPHSNVAYLREEVSSTCVGMGEELISITFVLLNTEHH